MMISDQGNLILSPGDITASLACEFGWLRDADVTLGRTPRAKRPNAMRERLAELGKAHEARVTSDLRQRPGSFETVTRPPFPLTEAKIFAAASETCHDAEVGVDVIGQAVLFDGLTYGIADYLIKQPDGTYAVWDAKLARSATKTAGMQLAIYAELMSQAGIPRCATAGLFLGNGKAVEIDLDELILAAREQLTVARRIMTDHIERPTAIRWGDDSVPICGKCDHCIPEMEASDDVLLVHNLSRRDRARMRTSGITTVQELASSTATAEGIADQRWQKLRSQAQMQTRHVVHPDGSVTVAYEVFDEQPIEALPQPDAGDIFFDFEGDVMFEGNEGDLGIEYLWGLLEDDGTPHGSFTPLWADDREAERSALVTFVDHVARRRAERPDMHIYHYASYEISALVRLCRRHGFGREAVTGWIAEGVFVDLNPVVTKSVRISQRSYSIKMLEPLYMSDLERDQAGVTSAVASITGYAAYCDARAAGDSATAARLRDQLIEYNRYDCLSTWRLRDWLLSCVQS